jgi:RHS repeat-associated protein
MTDASGTRTLSYHASGQLEDEVYTAGLLNGLSVDRGYDSLFRLGSVSALSASSALNQIGYAYDAASRMDTVTQGANSATYAYLANSPLIESVTFKQGAATRLVTSKAYDNLNRLSSVGNLPSVGTTRSFAYQYNGANQRVRATQHDGAYWRYDYDPLGQVVGAKKHLAGDTPALGLDHAWTYDDIGNRKTATINSSTSNYSANALNQYSSRSVPGVLEVRGEAQADATVTYTLDNGLPQATTRQGGTFYNQFTVDNATAAASTSLKVTGVKNLVGAAGEDAVTELTRLAFTPKSPEIYAHDLDGNLIDDAQWRYTWDGENRLIAIETQAAAVAAGATKLQLEFAYDSQSRRFAQKSYTWNTATSAWQLAESLLLVYDGWHILAELDALNANTPVRSYAWGLDLSGSRGGAGGVGGLLFTNTHLPSPNSAVYAAAYDGNGNVIAYVDMATGAKSATYEYNAFGETIISDGPAAELFPFKFSTRYTDNETGIIMFPLRPYSSSNGRFLCKDPIEEQGGVNQYAFVGNNALSRIDGLGLKLTPYTGDPTSLPLTVNTRPISGVRPDRGEAGIDWPPVVAKTQGACVVIGGELRLNPTYRPHLVADPYNNSDVDDFGQTTAQHERYHDLLAKDDWNRSLALVDYWEGCYCTNECATLAAKAANARNEAALWRNVVRQYEYDYGAYGSNPGAAYQKGAMDFEFGGIKNTADRKAKEAREAVSAYIASSCAKKK